MSFSLAPLLPLLPCAPCCPPFVLHSLFYLNLTTSLPPLLPSQAKHCKAPRQLHLLSVRNKGEGHARRSWHQPVTLPSLLPPSASLLNQITPLTHAHTNPSFNQLPSLSLLLPLRLLLYGTLHPLLSLSASFPHTV